MNPVCTRGATPPAETPGGRCPIADYRLLLERLDQALRRLVESGGREHEPLAAVYTEMWPDGLSMRLARHADGSFTAHLSGGGRLRFRDLDELGAAALCMCDRELYDHVRGARE